MSGGPPHHPHNRQVPATNTAWNHLQVPNYFPRPQLAHMSNEHSLLTWHTPTTPDAMKIHPHAHMFNEMLKTNEPIFPKDCVDLSLTRNGNQNGELSTTPISLSVRDANKINSLPASALEIQAVELTKCQSPSMNSPVLKTSAAPPCIKSVSPGLKSASPSIKTASAPAPSLKPASPSIKVGSPLSPNLKCDSPSLKTDNLALKPTSPSLSTQIIPEIAKSQQKRSNVRVDSILERLNPLQEKPTATQENKIVEDASIKPTTENTQSEKPVSVIVQAASGNFDENSNSNSISNIPVCTNIRDEDTISTNSNEDSLDSTKSRRKRKPCKTVRVSKEDEKLEEKQNADKVEIVSKEENEQDKDSLHVVGQMLEESTKTQETRSPADLEDLIPAKTRRKASSESETIDNIAAMVQEGLKEKELKKESPVDTVTKPISVSVIKTKENIEAEVSSPATPNSNNSNLPSNIVTAAQKKTSNTHFVEVENKLEEMFAGIEDCGDPVKVDSLKTDCIDLEDGKSEDTLLKLDDSLTANANSPAQENVTSTTEVGKKTPTSSKKKRKMSSFQSEVSPKKKKSNKKNGSDGKLSTKMKSSQKNVVLKVDNNKDIYAYDSSSNASSSKSRGPYIQIRGCRDSPLSVNVVNTPLNEDDIEKKVSKSKKFHDDTEYRHKVRSKGLHSSTLSHKYDAQTKDATWICAFCKRGPHATELSGPTLNGIIPAPGDLFGPYFITKDCPEFEKRLDDPFDKQFKSKKIVRALEESALQAKPKKSKRKHSDVDQNSFDIYLGITATDNQTFEVWAHEDCIVWAPGIYLIGPKIVGLEEAIWLSCNVVCRSCNLKGANICCARRGCLTTMHLCCARAKDWQFIQSTFKAYCAQHKLL